MADVRYPPMTFIFGSGAPGAGVPTSSIYYDTTTTPYTPYIFNAGAWHIFGGGTGGTGNATQLQGRAISAAAPALNNVLAWNGSAWAPTAPSGGPTPSIVQVGQVSGTVGTVTMGSAPTANNLLVAIVLTTAVNPPAGAGWTLLPGSQINGSIDDLGIFYKIAGASEPTTQTPTTAAGSGIVCIFELHNASTAIFADALNVTSATQTTAIVAQQGQMIIGVSSMHAASQTTSSFTGTTANGGVNTGGSQSQQAFHATSPAQGSQTLGVVWSASVQGSVVLIEIG